MIGTLYVRIDDESRFLFVADGASRERHPTCCNVWRLLVTGYDCRGGAGTGPRACFEFSMREHGGERRSATSSMIQEERLPEVA